MSELSGNRPWPTPLQERKGGLGKVVREFVQDTEEKGDDDAAYARLMARGSRAIHCGHRGTLLAAGLAAGCALALAALVGRDRTPSRPAMSPTPRSLPTQVTPSARAASAARSPAPARPALAPSRSAPTTSVRLRERPTALPSGRVDLNGQAIAVLSRDAAASGRVVGADTEIVLGQGDIELQVLPRAPGHGFRVRTGVYQFTVVGTAFSVSQTQSRLALAVREGTVAVSRGSKRLATVSAPGQWSVALHPVTLPVASPSAASAPPPQPSTPSSPATPPSAASVSLTPPGAASPPSATSPPVVATLAPSAQPESRPTPAPSRPADCRQLVASQHTNEALLCYREQAAMRGLAGETAQYELARLWRDSLGDLQRALAAFQEQRARFPKGALRIEADLSIIELLPRLGRHDEAMAETERFLADHPRAERRGELRLLRGNILREVLHDLGRAEREYAQGTEVGGRAGDDCRFLRGVCLEALGRVAEARKVYEAYLLGHGATHAQEVKQRLERLRP